MLTSSGRGKNSQVRSRLERDMRPGAEAGQGWQVTDTVRLARRSDSWTQAPALRLRMETLSETSSHSLGLYPPEQQLRQVEAEHSIHAGALRTQDLVLFNSN